jgi:cytochrome P450
MSVAGTAIPSSDLDPYSDAFLEDPYPRFRELRDLGPVVYLAAHDVYAFPRYAEVRAALKDYERYSNASGIGLTDAYNAAPGIIHTDPPEHERERVFMARPISTRGLRDVAGRIADEAGALVEETLSRGTVDGVRDFAQHIPLMIVAQLVGLPDSGRERMLEWAADGFNAIGPLNERTERALAGFAGLHAYLDDEVTPETVLPGSWASYVFEQAEEDGIPLDAAKAAIASYVVPSLDTTIQGMANAVWLFGRHSDQWDLLRGQPELVNRAINEILRLESPVQIFSRVVAGGACDVAGVTIPDGGRVLIMFASANRDERKWDDPERFDITRDGVSEHLAFGFGPHVCIGQGLARLELRALLTAMIERIKRIDVGSWERPLNNTLRGFLRMEISVS